jgi:hypothetical protein
MAKSKHVLAVLAGVAAVVAGGTAALAHGTQDHVSQTVPASAPADAAMFFAAALNGRNEIPVAGGPAVGDPDGQAVELLRIKGNQVSFAIKWKNIGAPTAGHIHVGVSGANGAVQIPFFGAGISDNLEAVTGSVTVTDHALLDSLKSNPAGFYVNLHTAAFPGGAVRGQLHAITHPVDLTSVLRGGPLTAILDGDQEVPAVGTVVGDADGHASAFVGAKGGRVNFSFTWSGIGAPTNGHIHQGAVGVNGPVAVPLFAAPAGLPGSLSGIAGVVNGVKPELTRRINASPADFYTNLHTVEFSGGAVRGQLFRTSEGNRDDDTFDQSSFVASVVRGEQIYACAKQADGTFAFTQHNVSATLRGGIAHSFVKDDAGPPQWVARDRSAVTGTLLHKTANGAGNIPELELDLTQAGAPAGQLAGAIEVLRLNTVGGVAPAGPCDPQRQPIAKSPYQADYLFITK